MQRVLKTNGSKILEILVLRRIWLSFIGHTKFGKKRNVFFLILPGWSVLPPCRKVSIMQGPDFKQPGQGIRSSPEWLGQTSPTGSISFFSLEVAVDRD